MAADWSALTSFLRGGSRVLSGHPGIAPLGCRYQEIGGLGVMCSQVVQPGDGWLASEG